jgi:hypothetical protein
MERSVPERMTGASKVRRTLTCHAPARVADAPTLAERRAMTLGRRELDSGEFVTLENLSREVGGSDRETRGPGRRRGAAR